MSESDSSDISSIDSVDTEEEFRPHEVSEQLNGEYNSFTEFETDFAAYQAATFQTYVKLRSEKLQQSHVLYEALQFRKVVYSCVHHRAYKSKGTGKRKFVHSRKKECGAEVRIAAQLRRGVIEVQTRNEVHNHALSEHVWKHLPENRRLTRDEEAKVVSLATSHVATNAIKKQVIKDSNKVITSKDVANIRQKLEKSERKGRSEVEMINHVLVEYQKKDHIRTV